MDQPEVALDMLTEFIHTKKITATQVNPTYADTEL